MNRGVAFLPVFLPAMRSLEKTTLQSQRSDPTRLLLLSTVGNTIVCSMSVYICPQPNVKHVRYVLYVGYTTRR